MIATKTSSAPRFAALKRSGGFTAGLLLALSGLVLSLAAAAGYALRAAGANVPAEPALAVGLRCAGGAGLVIVGFALMVICSRGGEADTTDPEFSDRSAEIAAVMAGEDLLCRSCGASNDYLARFCDQCGKRL